MAKIGGGNPTDFSPIARLKEQRDRDRAALLESNAAPMSDYELRTKYY